MTVVELKVDNRVLISRCRVAKDFVSRFVGLMGRTSLSTNEAILFPKCNSVHTFFMRMPIDVILVANDGEVVELITSMHPWRMLAPRKRVKHIIEMAPELAPKLGISVGTRLVCEEVWK